MHCWVASSGEARGHAAPTSGGLILDLRARVSPRGGITLGYFHLTAPGLLKGMLHPSLGGLEIKRYLLTKQWHSGDIRAARVAG